MNLSFVYLGESQYFTKLEKPDYQGNPGWDAFGGHVMLLYSPRNWWASIRLVTWFRFVCRMHVVPNVVIYPQSFTMFLFQTPEFNKANWCISRNPSKAPAPYCGCWLTNQPARRSLMRPWGHMGHGGRHLLVTMTLWIYVNLMNTLLYYLISRWHGCHTTFGHTNHPALSLPAYVDE